MDRFPWASVEFWLLRFQCSDRILNLSDSVPDILHVYVVCNHSVSTHWYIVSTALRTACNFRKPITFTFQLGSSTITPSKTARNLGVVNDDKLNFSDHIAKTPWSCRFALYNIRRIRPFLSEHATQLLVQALVLSRLDYCNALLAGFPANSFKPLQLI